MTNDFVVGSVDDMADDEQKNPIEDLIPMYHPSLNGETATTNRQAFEETWKPKGWKEGERPTAERSRGKEG